MYAFSHVHVIILTLSILSSSLIHTHTLSLLHSLHTLVHPHSLFTRFHCDIALVLSFSTFSSLFSLFPLSCTCSSHILCSLRRSLSHPPTLFSSFSSSLYLHLFSLPSFSQRLTGISPPNFSSGCPFAFALHFRFCRIDFTSLVSFSLSLSCWLDSFSLLPSPSHVSLLSSPSLVSLFGHQSPALILFSNNCPPL